MTTIQDPFLAARAALQSALGDSHVLDDEGARQLWARSTLPSDVLPRAIVRPGSTSEVQAVVRIANEHGLTIYPVSTGRNWGYGDACAVGEGSVVVDLGRMNRILEVDAELAYATVEPGVTQGQLADYLAEHELPVWMDATGAGPNASIIGNIVERGFGHSIHGDRFLHACGMEVVLPDGRVLRTGFGHYAGAHSSPVYRWGVGPWLDGLFTQSNLGIVTRLTFWLIPEPERFKMVVFGVREPGQISGLFEALRPLRLRGTLGSTIHVANDLRLLSMFRSYPWEEMGGCTPLSGDVRAGLRERHKLDAWLGFAALYGSAREVNAAKREVRRALRDVPGLTRVTVLDERFMDRAGRFLAWLGRHGTGEGLRLKFAKLQLGFDLLRGRSPPNSIQGGLWRVRRTEGAAKSADPRDYNAGFIWLSPVLPMSRGHIERLFGVMEPIFERYGFELQATLSTVTARSLCAVTTIPFDRDDARDVANARACHDECLAALIDAGYPPYRASTMSMSMLDRGSQVFFDVAADIKRVLDPHAILAPGRYDPVRARAIGAHGIRGAGATAAAAAPPIDLAAQAGADEPGGDGEFRARARLHELDLNAWEFSIAVTCAEYEEALALVHRAYAHRGYEPKGIQPLHLTAHHLLRECVVVTARRRGDLAGTLSLFGDTPVGLPLDRSYRRELDELRRQGARLTEGGCLAIAPEFRRSGLNPLLTLIAQALASRILESTHLVSGVNPAAVPFYRAVFNFGVLGATKQHHELNARLVGIAFEAAHQRDFLREHFPAGHVSGAAVHEALYERILDSVEMPEALRRGGIEGWAAGPGLRSELLRLLPPTDADRAVIAHAQTQGAAQQEHVIAFSRAPAELALRAGGHRG